MLYMLWDDDSFDLLEVLVDDRYDLVDLDESD